jgi:AsmA protein
MGEMQKTKVLAGLVGGFLALACLLLTSVWLLVNPNSYKAEIAARVQQSTGRELILLGGIKLSVLPWLAFEVGPSSLANPPGFDDGPFLSVEHASLRVKLMPLLRRQLQISGVELTGLDLRLKRNPQGQGNWQGVRIAPNLAPGAERTTIPQSAISLMDVRIRDGRITYGTVTVEHLDLQSGSIALDEKMPVSVTFDANRGVAGESIAVTAKFDVSENPVGQQMQMAAVNLSGTLTRPDQARPVHWDLSAATLEADLSEQTAQVPAFSLSYSNAHLTGSVVATKALDGLSMAGKMVLAPLLLREFAPRIGVEIPKTRDPKVFSMFSAAGDFAYDSHSLRLVNLLAHLDDSQIQGSIQFSDLGREALAFDLTADQIDIDRYRAGTAGSSSLESASARTNKPIDINVEGTMKVAAAHALGVDLTNFRLTVSAQDGLDHFFPLEAQLDGGRYSGDIVLDRRSAVPVLSVDEHLAGVDMDRLLAKSAQKGRLSGRATLNLKGSARGGSLDSFLKTFNGHLDADLAQGAYEGVDVDYEIKHAQALITRSRELPQNTHHTRFDAFKTSAQITNGSAQTQALLISSETLRVTGHGSANLSTKALNLQLLVSVLKAPGSTLVDIPLKVTGSYLDPAVSADIESVAKGQIKQKLEDLLKKNGLQGLFSK